MARTLREELAQSTVGMPHGGLTDKLSYDVGTDTVDIAAAHVTANGNALGAGGGSAFAHLTEHVFEVASLLVPSGTDWTALGHNLGSFEVASDALVLFKTYLEVAAPIDPDDLFLDISDIPDYSTSSTPSETHLNPRASALWTSASNWNIYGSGTAPADAAGEAHSADPLIGGNSFHSGVTASPGSDLKTITANLHMSGVSTADITVVKARAAFLVL